jgi:DNA-binding HxlR family transcriptional regulator
LKARPGKDAGKAGARRPVMELLDLVGQRWTLRILWELREAPLSFRALQERAGGLSPSVLNDRLRALREAGIVELGAEGYALSALGQELGARLLDLTVWAERWARKRGRSQG